MSPILSGRFSTTSTTWEAHEQFILSPYHGSDRKESACNARDPGSISGSGRTLRGGNGNSLQYSCLENPMDRGLQSTGSQRAVTEPLSLFILTQNILVQWYFISNIVLYYLTICEILS